MRTLRPIICSSNSPNEPSRNASTSISGKTIFVTLPIFTDPYFRLSTSHNSRLTTISISLISRRPTEFSFPIVKRSFCYPKATADFLGLFPRFLTLNSRYNCSSENLIRGISRLLMATYPQGLWISGHEKLNRLYYFRDFRGKIFMKIRYLEVI
jgi:hypothetical protein